MKTTLHLTVSGRVQGVGFRYFTQYAAQALGLTGYVKNLYNGDVEIYAEGSKDKLTQFLLQIHKGPALSRVLQVREQWSEAGESHYKSFLITH